MIYNTGPAVLRGRFLTTMDLRLLKEFLKDKNVAAIAPSSRHLVNRLIRRLRPEGIKVMVELGPGPAVATKPILHMLGKQARFLVVERNPMFVSHLRKIADPRLEVVEGDARKLKQLLAERGIAAADAVIASIPFTYLTPADRTALVSAAYDSLRPGGDFIIFHQYSPLMAKYLKKKFGRVHIEFELFNLFPCFLMHVKK